VGGAALLVQDRLPDLDSDGPSDIEVEVRFTDADEFQAAVDHGFVAITGPANIHGAIDVESRRCVVLSDTSESADSAWQLRQIAPIFSAVLGQLVLHASAVEVKRTVIGFIGGTGVGKSTLAAYMLAHGSPLVSDDLLPVRFTPEAATLTAEGSPLIGALCFLRWTNSKGVSMDRLDVTTALEHHLVNGFGEHRHGDTWATQFDGYHPLAETVPHYALAMPVDLNALPKVADAIRRANTVDNASPNASR
jgi:hypothetical protein